MILLSVLSAGHRRQANHECDNMNVWHLWVHEVLCTLSSFNCSQGLEYS